MSNHDTVAKPVVRNDERKREREGGVPCAKINDVLTRLFTEGSFNWENVEEETEEIGFSSLGMWIFARTEKTESGNKLYGVARAFRNCALDEKRRRVETEMKNEKENETARERERERESTDPAVNNMTARLFQISSFLPSQASRWNAWERNNKKREERNLAQGWSEENGFVSFG